MYYKKKYRIIRVDGDNGRSYYPQRRTFFGKWVCMFDWSNTIQQFKSLENAIDYLECNDIQSIPMIVWEGEE